MSIGSYPRVTVQGTGATNNPANGLGLMLYNSTSGQYEAATAATFGGGGGAGGATEANQYTQIDLAQETINKLTEPVMGSSISELLFNNDTEESAAQLLKNINNASYAYGQPFAEYLNTIANNTNDAKNTLNSIYNLLNNGQAKVVVVSTTGDSVGVTAGRLNVDTGA